MQRGTKLAIGLGAVGLYCLAPRPDSMVTPWTGLSLGFFYEHLGGLFRKFSDAEESHKFAIHCAGLSPRVRAALGLTDLRKDPANLQIRVFGCDFKNPLGVAAGFDKDAKALDGLLDMGFSFVEAGSITPLPQPGNPKPRVFRLDEDRAIINRYGFNSEGAEAAKERLAAFQERPFDGAATRLASQLAASYAELKKKGDGEEAADRFRQQHRGIVGVNLGKNKEGEAGADYAAGVATLGPYADYLVVNISSPNTPGLRALQGRRELQDLLGKVKEAHRALERRPPLLVKISPDLTIEDRLDVAVVCVESGCVDGLIVSNTTLARPSTLKSPHAKETGGLSGPPLMEPSTRLVEDMYTLTAGSLPIIGVGGITTGEDAYRKVRAGASLCALYTGFAYGGPNRVAGIKAELSRALARDGFASVVDAVGADQREMYERQQQQRAHGEKV